MYAPTSDALKVQTSRGNYLSSLSVRTKQVDFDDPDLWESSTDDLVLKAAIWQDDHWVYQSALLKVVQSSERFKGAVKVVLLSLDRNRELSLFHLDHRSLRTCFLSSPQDPGMTSGCCWREGPQRHCILY